MPDLLFHPSDRALSLIRRIGARRSLPHALILSGGSERIAAAYYAACAFECTAGQKPCLSCSACRKVLNGIHPDVTIVQDTEHAEISAETVRAVRTDAFIRPNEGARKVYLFEDCSLLNEKDQNILLKIVEEGPSYAAFLFCTENTASLLQTIRSRCIELKLPAAVDSAEEESTKAQELCQLIAQGSVSARTAFFTKLENEKPSREQIAAFLEQTRARFADALFSLYGASAEASSPQSTALLTSRLTKSQILGTIELLETYRNHCNYNVGIGPLLGGLTVELEEIL